MTAGSVMFVFWQRALYVKQVGAFAAFARMTLTGGKDCENKPEVEWNKYCLFYKPLFPPGTLESFKMLMEHEDRKGLGVRRSMETLAARSDRNLQS